MEKKSHCEVCLCPEFSVYQKDSRIQFDVSYKNLSTPAFALLADFFEYFGAPDWLMELSNKSGALKDSKKSAKRAKAGLDRFL